MAQRGRDDDSSDEDRRYCGGGDAEIAKALEEAFLPSLLPALAQATETSRCCATPRWLVVMTPGIAQGGMLAAQQDAARALALAAIGRLRDGQISTTPRRLEHDYGRSRSG